MRYAQLPAQRCGTELSAPHGRALLKREGRLRHGAAGPRRRESHTRRQLRKTTQRRQREGRETPQPAQGRRTPPPRAAGGPPGTGLKGRWEGRGRGGARVSPRRGLGSRRPPSRGLLRPPRMTSPRTARAAYLSAAVLVKRPRPAARPPLGASVAAWLRDAAPPRPARRTEGGRRARWKLRWRRVCERGAGRASSRRRRSLAGSPSSPARLPASPALRRRLRALPGEGRRPSAPLPPAPIVCPAPARPPPSLPPPGGAAAAAAPTMTSIHFVVHPLPGTEDQLNDR